MENQALYQLFEERQSDRKFDLSRPVEEEVVCRIVDAARLSPSACNSQPWDVVAVTDPEKAKAIGEAALKGIIGLNKFIETAPVHIIIVAKNPNAISYLGGKMRNINFVPYDIGIFMAHLTLAAAAEGLGTCMIGIFNGKAVAEELGVPHGERVVFDIVLGYSADKTRTKKRRKLGEVLHLNKW